MMNKYPTNDLKKKPLTKYMINHKHILHFLKKIKRKEVSLGIKLGNKTI